MQEENKTCSFEDNFPKNTGIIIEEQVPESDFKAGGISGIEFREVLPLGKWYEYRSKDEPQHGVYFDTFACVTFSAINSLEMQVNRLIIDNLISPSVYKELKDLGYIDENGRFRCSNRFTANMSGTTRMGNHINTVWDSIRKDGVLPYSDLDFNYDQRTPVFDWDDYYSEIPQVLKDKAKKFLTYFNVQYEWVIMNGGQMSEGERETIKIHLKQAPLQVAAAVCRGWNDGDTKPVPNCGSTTTSHATVISGMDELDNFIDIDHYRPFFKKLDKNYPLPWVMKGIVEQRDYPLEDIPKENFSFKFDFRLYGQVSFGQRGEIVKKLQTALSILGFLKKELITGFYWYGTKNAVYLWQKKNKVGSPQEIETHQGKYFGPKGMQKMNEIFGNS